MVNISPALSSAQAKSYHEHEFANAKQQYYTNQGTVVGEWRGRLAAEWGLTGPVQPEHYNRVMDGQHPHTGEQLVKHQTKHTITRANGTKVTTMAHRAGWDATFSAPKSFSVTALVGGDTRLLGIHDRAVKQAIDYALEPSTMARIPGGVPAVPTEKFIAALFQHDSARPVPVEIDGKTQLQVDPQIHTHVVIANLAELDNGDTRSVQSRQIFNVQSVATEVYRTTIEYEARRLGYEVQRDPETDAPEIVGYTPEYLAANGARRAQIEAYLLRTSRTGARASQIAAHQTREAKVHLSPELVHEQHQALDAAHGHQTATVIADAQAKPQPVPLDPWRPSVDTAVTYAKDRNIESEAVLDERFLLRDALRRVDGHRTVDEVRDGLHRRLATPEFVRVHAEPAMPGRYYSTPEMIALERENVARMRAGHDRFDPIAPAHIRRDVQDHYPHLNGDQLTVVEKFLGSRDQVSELDGVAGGGKSRSLVAIMDAATRAGWKVEGFAPTSKAAEVLADLGIPSKTLQAHLAQPPDGVERMRRHLYLPDEMTLASTVQFNTFLKQLNPRDRVLLVGDVRQHQAVDAGIPFEQMQHAGVHIMRLRQIMRQDEPELRSAVQDLADGRVRPAVAKLTEQGRIHDVPDRDDRFTAIATHYVQDPKRTLVISPDNESRTDLNVVLHTAMQANGRVEHQEHPVPVLVSRDMRAAERQWVERYHLDDVLRFNKGSRSDGVAAGSYARVTAINAPKNQLTIETDSGRRITYDPKRFHGVTVYQEAIRQMSVGERMQFTTPGRILKVTNRQLSTLEKIGPKGELHLRMDKDDRRVVVSAPRKHVDYGYVLTSHSAQGLTADKVLFHIDTDRAGEKLVNRRSAYVGISRASVDAHVYTNDEAFLPHALNRIVSKRSALRPDQVAAPRPRAAARAEHVPEVA